MQHYTGTNPSEATSNDTKSSSWKFILRNASYPRLPEAFLPHCNTLTWIATPQGRTSNWLIRGYIRFNNRTNYYTLKHRYSKQSEWIPVPWNDMRPYNEFAVDSIPHNGLRYVKTNEKQTPLHKVGFNIEVPDLVEDYHSLLWIEEQESYRDPEFEAREATRKKRKREEQEYWEAKIAAEEEASSGPREFFVTDAFGNRHFTGGRTASGQYYSAYNKRLGRFND